MKKRCYIYYLVFLFTFMDIAFTTIGLQLGVIEEANPIMDYFFSFSMWLSMLVVLLLVGALLLFIYKVSIRIPWVRYALTILLGVKVYVLLLHLNWISSFLGS